MDALRQIEFSDALRRLQGLIGTEVKVTVNFYGHFFGCGFEGELARVETLPPDDSAVNLILDGRQGFFLDPAEAKAFVVRDEGNADWLEFRLACDACVVVEGAGDEAELGESVSR